MKPVSLDMLFNNKIFRIPDYQRGFAWQTEQLRQFWDDLVNLAEGRSHYTGLITMREIAVDNFTDRYKKERWLMKEHSHRAYHIVDGQQRLTTLILLLQAFVELKRSLCKDKSDRDIYVSETLTIDDAVEKYIVRKHPRDLYRTYKFGYDADNPSCEFFRHKIVGEPAIGAVDETFYTLNLTRAKEYFSKRLMQLYESNGTRGLQEMYLKVTRSLLFNEYAIEDDFDVYVAFETMNNRGKPLSNLELLKNRLIYLVTLYPDLDAITRDHLRQRINEVWKGVYHQLGRNKASPLNDDEFLRAHWIMYFGFDSKTNFSSFLLDDYFSPRRAQTPAAATVHSRGFLEPAEIDKYVVSLGASAPHWFNLHFPRHSRYPALEDAEVAALLKLHRVGVRYFKPLIMAVLKNETDSVKRTEAFKSMERFVFLAFHVHALRSNYARPEFLRAACQVDRSEKTGLAMVHQKLSGRLSWMFREDGTFNVRWFRGSMARKFADGGRGYYAWSGLRHLLFEYELHLQGSRPSKVSWEYLKKSKRDMVTVEHIAPQGPNKHWRPTFEDHDAFRDPAGQEGDATFGELYHRYVNSLGNLLLLSRSVNSALQDHSFERKKEASSDSKGNTLRDGYANGSHSELEVAMQESWGPEEIRERGMKLLTFFEDRWQVRFRSEEEKERLLMLSVDS